MWWNSNFWWGTSIMMFIGVIFWGSIIALIVWAVLHFSRKTKSSNDSYQKPIDIAKERYARGEINREQFEQIKNDLLQ